MAEVIRELKRLVFGSKGFKEKNSIAFAESFHEISKAAQESSADYTTAYLDMVYNSLQEDIDLEGISPPDNYRGEDPQKVYVRPSEQYRYYFTKKRDEEAAAKAAITRAENIITADISRAGDYVARDVMSRSKRTKVYRRILRPELSRNGPCGICVAAATRVYTVKELKAIHNGCCCTVAPITSAGDPGLKLNQDDLEKLYAAAGSTYKEDLQRIRVQITEHGELGPILSNAEYRKLTKRQALARQR